MKVVLHLLSNDMLNERLDLVNGDARSNKTLAVFCEVSFANNGRAKPEVLD